MEKSRIRRMWRWPANLLLLLAIIALILAFLGTDLGLGPNAAWILWGLAVGFGFGGVVVGLSGFGAPRFRRADLFDFVPKGAKATITTNDEEADPIEIPMVPGFMNGVPGHGFAAAPAGAAFADGVTSVTVGIVWEDDLATVHSFTIDVVPKPPNDEEYARRLRITLNGPDGDGKFHAFAVLTHAVDDMDEFHITHGTYEV